MKVYIAGPMRGYPQCNFPAFAAAQRILERAGYETINPAAEDEKLHGVGFLDHALSCDDAELADVTFDMDETIRRDVGFILDADAIVLLPGWAGSTGAQTELAVARWAKRKVGFLIAGRWVRWE